MSLQRMTPALPGAKLCSVIIEWMWPPAAPHRKQAGPRIAARRMSKLRHGASSPTRPKPTLAKPTSSWNGLSAQPISSAAICVAEGMEGGVVDVGDADREEEEPLEQRLGDHRAGRAASAFARARHREDDQADDEEGEREVAEDEEGDAFHRRPPGGDSRRGQFRSLPERRQPQSEATVFSAPSSSLPVLVEERRLAEPADPVGAVGPVLDERQSDEHLPVFASRRAPGCRCSP